MAEAIDSSRELVLIAIAGRRYALSPSYVREVLQMMEPTPMPGWPEEALGIIEVRGELVPLIDIAPQLGSAMLEPSTDQFIVLLEDGARSWGVVVERVEGVQTLFVPPLDPASPVASMASIPGFQGLAVDSQGPIVIVNATELLRRYRGMQAVSPAGNAATGP
jgi:purine-binding chemotaxis protein CheW